jgi:hypothetical protein
MLSIEFLHHGLDSEMSMRKLLLNFSTLLIASALLSTPAFSFSQENRASSQDQNESIEGTVVSSNRSTFVVRTDENKFYLYTFDRNTTKPRTLPVGTRVRVASTQGDETGARQATNVVVSAAAPKAESTGTQAAPIPPAIRGVESDIKREARRWRLGARAGVALDPELVMFGVHSQMGPIFSRNVFFRPNAEFAWGEVTDMVAVNLEAIYRMPVSSRRGSWSSYVGAGPALNFIHQSFKTQTGQARNISFGNFDYETGFNVLMGLQYRSDTFFEIKTSLYSQPAPVLRLILGRNF